MRIVVAMDSFKGCLSSAEAGQAVAAGVKRVLPQAEVVVCPLADGGEGTAEILARGLGGRLEQVAVEGAYREPVDCVYGIIEEKRLAVLAAADVVGLTLTPVERRNPLLASTYGLGEVILDALAKGCRTFLIGLGGSGTNDGGAGMLQALGVRLLDENGAELARGAAGLRTLASVSLTKRFEALADCRFYVGCDVTNPLCGENGCSRVFGAQKGADAQMIADMDSWLSAYAALTREMLPHANAVCAGAGAAGGLGFAFQSYLRASLQAGVQLVLEATGFREVLAGASLVLTGEGCFDAQTAMGKAVCGVTALARQCGVPVAVLAGSVGEEIDSEMLDGTAVFQIQRRLVTLEQAMEPERARRSLTATAEQVLRLFCAGR